MRTCEMYRRRNPEFFSQLRSNNEDEETLPGEEGLLTRDQFVQRQFDRDRQISELPLRDEYLRERIRATCNWDDSDDQFFARANAMRTLYGRYERDLASTGGKNIRAWKRILRDRMKARTRRLTFQAQMARRRLADADHQFSNAEEEALEEFRAQQRSNPRSPHFNVAHPSKMKRKYNPDRQAEKYVRNTENRAARGKSPYVPAWQKKRKAEKEAKEKAAQEAADKEAAEAAERGSLLDAANDNATNEEADRSAGNTYRSPGQSRGMFVMLSSGSQEESSSSRRPEVPSEPSHSLQVPAGRRRRSHRGR